MDVPEFLRPPGTHSDIVAHPVDSERAIEVAVVQDHRFAFFYWSKWRQQNGVAPPPSLVSLDWHQDLVAPDIDECELLKKLKTDDFNAVSHFCWDKLHSLNDGHILAAAYLNVIGDIHVVAKQRDECPEDFVDIAGSIHALWCHESVESLLEAVRGQVCTSVLFDIDLDYFTESADSCGGGSDLKLVETSEIERCLRPDGDLMSWIFPRLSGMTIATEPEFCGGLLNSNELFRTVHNILFYPPLLTTRAGWRHRSHAAGRIVRAETP